MARIRTIKPEFCQSEKIGKLSRDARLLFIQLWTFVDDLGRCRGSSRLLAANLYPFDDDVPDLISPWLDELERGQHIRRYIVDRTTYLEIINWGKHQRIDNAGKSRIPEFSPQFAETRGETSIVAESNGEPPLYLGPSTKDLGPRKEEVVALRAPASVKEKIVSRGTMLADDWKPTDDDFKFATDQGLRLVEIEIEATKFRNYWTAKSGKDAVKRNWPRTWENWILKATESKGYRNGKTNLLDEGRELAERAREFEREAGIGRPSDPFGSH